MIVRSAGKDFDAAVHQIPGKGLRVVDDVLRVDFELRFQSFAVADGLCCDDVHQRAALQTREDGLVDLVVHSKIVGGHDHAAARSAQCFVRGAGRHVGVRDRAHVTSGRYQAGDVRDVSQQERIYFIRDLPEFFKVDLTRVGTRAADDQLWPRFFCNL